jgi:hypothetical protein
MTARVCDVWAGGLGWIEDDRLGRCGHALVDAGRAWLVDPFALPTGLSAEVVAVVQLLDRHNRACAECAAYFGVPLLRVPGSIPEAPFEAVRVVDLPRWREIALWWPERQALVCADALGTVDYFRAQGERLGVHPLLRLTPPRRLDRLDADTVLVGHGEGIIGGASALLHEALATSRRRIPSWLLTRVRG